MAILFDVMHYHRHYPCLNLRTDPWIHTKNCPHDFIAAYAIPWSSNASRNWVHAQDHAAVRPFYLQYHTRSSVTVPSAAIASAEALPSAETPSGLLCERQVSSFALFGQSFQLVERRYSLSLRAKRVGPFGKYVIVALEDPILPGLSLPSICAPHSPLGVFEHVVIGFDEYGIQAFPDESDNIKSIDFGITQFLYLICRVTDYWYHDWESTLSQIDGMITVKVRDPKIGLSRCETTTNALACK